MKVANTELVVVETQNGNDAGIVVPVILYWLGAPITILIVLWLLGVI